MDKLQYEIGEQEAYWRYLALRDKVQTRLLSLIDQTDPNKILDGAQKEVLLQCKELAMSSEQFREKFIKVYISVRRTLGKRSIEVIKTRDDLDAYLDAKYPGFRVAFESIILKKEGIALSVEEMEGLRIS